MTSARPVVKNHSYLMTRRCAGRHFFLRPSKEVEQAFLYCFAVAAKDANLDVYWLSVMSSHYHDGVHDPEGKYPKFLQYFHSLVARCLNVHLDRSENFWSSDKTSVVQLGDDASLFEKMIYSLTNPVQSHLVDKVFNWPGISSLRYQLDDKPVVIQRPGWFFSDKSKLPEQVELSFVRPPEFAHLSHEEWTDMIRAAVAQEEAKAAAQREKTGRRVVGRKAILRQSPFSSPRTQAQRRGLRPQVASKDRWRRMELLNADKQFQRRYREAFARRRAGEVDVEFPYGTYQLRVLGLVRCEPAAAPALE